MNKSIIGITAALAMVVCPSMEAQNTPDQQVILSFHTNIYDKAGEGNAFHFELGATENIYVDVDCGYGLTEMEVKGATVSSAGIKGSVFAGSVSSAGNVTVYGDPSKIDYVMLEGLYMSEVDLSNLTNVEILNICYNDLESLDLSHMHKLMALYADANPCNKKAMVIGKDKPNLAILSLSMIDNLDSSFDLRDYPALQSFEAYSTPTLRSADPSNCPLLMRYSIDGSHVPSVDFSKNPELLIINVSDTPIKEVDLSPCTKLTEFYGTHHGAWNNEHKFKTIDVSQNYNLQRLFMSGNELTDIDLSNNDVLTDLFITDNYLEHLDVSNLNRLINVNVSNNLMYFSVLPEPKYAEYIYYQRPIAVDRCYKEGTTIDFSDKVLRKGTQTTATLFSVDHLDPRQMTPVDPSCYTYADGKITLNKALSDSLVIEFYNSMFSAYEMTTDRFMVKTAEDFGKPSAMAQLRFAANVRNPEITIGIQGATPSNPKTFYVDFGNGQLMPFTATSEELAATPNATGSRAGTIIIYTAEGDQLTALGVNDQRLLNVDFQNARALRTLSLTGCQLPSIVLQYNRELRTLDLSNNSLSSISLRGVNDLFAKVHLTNIDLSNNRLTAIDTEDTTGWLNLDISNNLFVSLAGMKLSNLETLNISGNKIVELPMRDFEALRVLNASGNQLSELEVPPYTPLEQVDLSMNEFTFSALPEAKAFASYTYAPQQPVLLPTTAPTVGLGAYLTAADGTVTQFKWYYAADNSEVPAGLIDENNGRFAFNDASMAEVYCAMTNAAFPAFTCDNAYKTTVVKPSEKPTYVWSSFKTMQDGIGEIILITDEAIADVYIDWADDGNLEPYVMLKGRNIFSVPVTAGADVKCYSLTENTGIKGLTVAAGKMSEADFSKLTKLTNFSLIGSQIGQDNIKMPESPDIDELRLENAGFTDMSAVLQKYPKLYMLDLSGNDLKTLDISSLKQLGLLFAPFCNLESVTLDNPRLWNLSLSYNSLEQIDLSKLPVLDQLFVDSNKFRTINLSVAPALRVVHINNNYFTFTTLPADAGYDIYDYANQAEYPAEEIDGKVDLSAQLKAGGFTTTYTWFEGVPGVDPNLELVGTLLSPEYFEVKDGVTTFLKSAYGVVCVMQNEAFPKLYLATPLMDIIVSGVEDVTADAPVSARVEGTMIKVAAPEGTEVVVTDLGGRMIGSAQGSAEFGPLAAGVYVARAGAESFKLLVK